jgi:glycosyltransferase involved in cell wall biosynthesis
MKVCSIVARNYLAHARVLAESLAEHHRDTTLALLLIDGSDADRPPSGTEAFEVLLPTDIGLDRGTFHQMAAVYDVTELSTALKPTLLRHLLACDEVAVYLDPDIEVHAPFLRQASELALRHGIVLTPHVLRPMPRDGKWITEQALLYSGMYNLGFIAVGRSAREFCSWWEERTRLDAISHPEQGLFTDQRWIDFVPSLFPHAIQRDPGWNVAYWNAHERPLSERADGTVLAAGAPLRFLHLSGFDHRHPYLLSRHQRHRPRTLLSENPVLSHLVTRYRDKLLAAGVTQAERIPYRFGRLNNGPFPIEVRRHLRRLILDPPPGTVAPPNPFDAGEELFLDWLNAPVAWPGGQPLPRLVRIVWESRPDLQVVYWGPDGPTGAALVEWAARDELFRERFGHLHQPERSRTGTADRRRARSGPVGPGVNVVGYLAAEMGVGESGRAIARAAERAGLPYSTYNYGSTFSRQAHEYKGVGPPTCPYDVNLFVVNADATPLFMAQQGHGLSEGRYRIGFWAWEVSLFPPPMHAGFDYVDEVWVPSPYSQSAIQPHTTKPVRVFPNPVIPHPPTFLSRSDVGLPEGFMFLFMFDYLSVTARKNPTAVVEAYKAAFRAGDGAFLVVKSINGDRDLASLEELRFLAGGRSDIMIMDGYLPRRHVAALTQLADCYVSLHRSEGSGLTMAEAMAQGKPVVATGYSGNLTFMDEKNSLLVPYKLTRVGYHNDPYPPQALWAEPDIEVAARHMRRVFQEPGWARQLGERARRSVESKVGLDASAILIRRLVEPLWVRDPLSGHPVPPPRMPGLASRGTVGPS